ncbi:hypothetical protein A1O1_01080 [Capronia coronata CBS 617.96]|uniref:BRCT domain-containing protein n=1 Tax=Capronia coronata CBS 617.96 TaxID=1182541 RepID=W9Z1Z1_9EURO|nr:uncharacterized protein A1O1_01080 [Capronia coronata CBS 617.96]EXJ95955.1 hypothetical protein A1O1_01080 [Capronia coronata CBS 617.96]
MAPRKAASPTKPRRITRARAAAPEATVTVEEPAKRKTSAAASRQTTTRTKAIQSTSTSAPAVPTTSRTRLNRSTPTTNSDIPTTTRTKAIEAKSRVGKKDSSATRATRTGKPGATLSNVTAALETIESGSEEDDGLAEKVAGTSTSMRTTARASAKAGQSTLAVAPRRRIRITPLEGINVDTMPQSEATPEPAKESSTKSKKEKATVSKSTTTRGKRGAVPVNRVEETEAGAAAETIEAESNQRGRGRGRKVATPKEAEAVTKTTVTGTKPRGRPKKEAAVADPLEKTKIAEPSTRQTRARGGSTSSSVLVEPNVHVVAPARKKVTFQEPPSDEDEKENKRPATLTKSRTAKKPATTTARKTDTTSRGMRAKPIRNPAVTKSTKTTRRGAPKPPMQSIDETEPEATEKVMPRILTPKKITQIAKAVPIDSEDDEEDELAGAKTPVRDLSLSPRRGIIPSMPRSASPVKKLDFGPVLNATSPTKSSAPPAVGIMSPPRRMPSSPNKDSLKESPRRAPEGITIFPAQFQDTSSSAPGALLPSSSHSLLQQSPKRGLSDKVIFPPSAIKSRNSPLKTALLSSPARRLFSPSKQRTPAQFPTSPKKNSPMKEATPSSAGQSQSPGDVDLVMTSHFRSSVSPQRMAKVYRLSDDELAHASNEDVDFDQSVLNVRSPLKVDQVKPNVTCALETIESDLALEHNREDDDHDDEGACLAQTGKNLAQQCLIPASEDLDRTANPNVDDDETMIDSTFEEESDDDQDMLQTLEASPNPVSVSDADDQPPVSNEPVGRPRLSNALFTRIRSHDDDSEDELAADQTPDNTLLRPSFRPSLTGANIRSRLSTGNVPSSATKALGVTPLATQVRGWHAASPEKRASLAALEPTSQKPFSPLARMHVKGTVEVSRQATPLRHGHKRRSVASRLSFAPSMAGSPTGPAFFAESMEAKDFEDQVEDHDNIATRHDEDLHGLVQEDVLAPQLPTTENHDDGDSGEESESLEQEPGELTTDLINFTHASNTAMVDFKELANEAEQLADPEEDVQQQRETMVGQDGYDRVPELETMDEEQSLLSTSSDFYGDENMAPMEGEHPSAMPEHHAQTEPSDLNVELNSPLGSRLDQDMAKNHQDTPGRNQPMEVAEQPDGTVLHTTESNMSTVAALAPASTQGSLDNGEDVVVDMDFNVTPVRPDPSLPRYVHTVSKVPLRPEGQIPSTLSPLKGQRKRPRSLSSSNSVSAISFGTKRRSLGEQANALAPAAGLLGSLRTTDEVRLSPQRRIRSAAPSPAHSLASQPTTPGQMSFAIEDFGDSTLDGIELPSDELTSDEIEAQYVAEHESARDEEEDTVITIGSALFKTPMVPSQRCSLALSSVKSNQTATPHYAMSTQSSKRRSSIAANEPPSRMTPSTTKTPVTSSKVKTPTTFLKSKTAAKMAQTSRPPLQAMSEGILNGAVVHYDIHTTEGMDASGVFVDLLTAMGARCVKEWRWNPRSSVTAGSGAYQNESDPAETPNIGTGITHVVYKDGGRRTLEKVRSAQNQVLCVGVGWVLDCYREGKWLDESAYAVDSSILPRGGSRRRRSMEPRMLVNENGLLSTTKENRRFTFGDHLGLTEAMKMDLINTPVRGRQEQEPAQCEQDNEPSEEVDVDAQGDVGEETETSFDSTYLYDSPAAATVGEDGQTANVGFLMSTAAPGKEGQLGENGEDYSTMMSNTPLSVSVSKGRQGRRVSAATTPKSTSLTVDYDPRTAATPMTPYFLAKGKGKGKEMVPASAPPKQLNKGIFDQDDSEEDGEPRVSSKTRQAGNGNGRKFQVKTTSRHGNEDKAGSSKPVDAAARRKTLGGNLNVGRRLGSGSGFKPFVGSPLRKE